MSAFSGRAPAWVLSFALLAGYTNTQASSLTLTDALRRTLADNRTLAVFPASLREADAQLLQAGLRPAPVLGVDVENIAGSGAASGSDVAEYTLVLSQTIELGDKRDKRAEVAQWQQRDVGASYDISRADVLAATASRFIESARAQAVAEWAQRRLSWATRSAQTAQQRASAGAESGAEVKRLEIAEVRARIALARAQSQQQQSHNQLAAMWGATQADFDQVAANLSTLPAIEPEQSWIDHLQNAPQLKRYLTHERLLSAQQRLIDAQATPDVTLHLGVRRIEDIDANALVLGASMPLAFGARNKAASAVASAQRERNAAEQREAALLLQVALRNHYQQLLITRTEAQLLRNEALPKAQLAYRDIERGYHAGRFSTLELLTAQDEQLALEREAIDAEASFHLQQIALQQLTGQAIAEVSP